MVHNSPRNAYADHLAQVNKNNAVVAAEDILNQVGGTIVTEGTAITEDTANKIALFNLIKPLELSVALESAITSEDLFHTVGTATQRIKVRDSEHMKVLQSSLSKLCVGYGQFPLIAQKLTVLQERMPDRYTRAQYSTAFATLLALKLRLNEESINIVFLAAQLYETGYLNIMPEHLGFMSTMEIKERSNLVKHQLNECKRFLDKVPNLSRRVSRTILEHRERKDGSGWPGRLLGDALCIESQILSAAALMSEMYIEKLRPRGFDTTDLIPVIQAEGEAFDVEVYNAIVELLKPSYKRDHSVVPEEYILPMARYISHLQRTVNECYGNLRQCLTELPEQTRNNGMAEISTILDSFERLFRNSGICTSELEDWLELTSEEELVNQYSDVEDAGLICEHVVRRLRQIKDSIACSTLSLMDSIQTQIGEISELLDTVPEDLFEGMSRYATPAA